jgi:hypothetical protein
MTPVPIRRSLFAAAPLVLAILLLFVSSAPADAPPAEARGLTTPSVIMTGGWEDDTGNTSLAPPAIAGEGGFAWSPPLGFRDDGWELIDADTFLARIPHGEACMVRFDLAGEGLVVLNETPPIIARSEEAMAYAPSWMSEDLRDVFSRVDSARQDLLAGLILGAEDPIVDEVAFVIAHTAVDVLTSGNLYPYLFIENAEDVYAHDPDLAYVEIVDYGSAAAGGDYWSTVRYRTAEAGDTIEVELPRERYYWDVVHPKITDEFPTYIDPATGEAADPPTGQFWREFLFTHADDGFPVLRDELAGCLTVWEGNVDTQVNGAIGVLTGFVLDVLDFGSGVERPIQPVRIYRLHLGRCGEHADFTAAIARAALIATNSSSAPDEDHTWNEFWDRRWVPWEPVNNYIDSGWHYEGWPKSFLGVFDWRGDDWTWTVTERYSPVCTLTVAATDSAGKPLDGAMVKIARKLGAGSFYLSTWGFTDHDGLADFILGDNHNIFLRIESSIGVFPSTVPYRKAVDLSQPGVHYYYTRNVNGFRPSIPLLPHEIPTPPWDRYAVRVKWNADEIVYGRNYYGNNMFADRVEGGAVDFFILLDTELAAYQAGDTAHAYEIHEEADSGDVSFALPEAGDYYVVLSNEEHVVNRQLVSCNVELYRRVLTGVAESGGAAPARTALLANEPNPFNPSTAIPFTLAREERVEVAVYDLSGRLVRSLFFGRLAAGDHEARWDGTDASGKPAGAGVYLCRLETESAKLHRKMVLVK